MNEKNGDCFDFVAAEEELFEARERLDAGDVADGVVAEVEKAERRKRADIGHVFDVVAGEVARGGDFVEGKVENAGNERKAKQQPKIH